MSAVDLPAAVAAARATLGAGGLALLPTDTVYGLAAALDDEGAIAALYALKGRPRSQPCQVLLCAAALRHAAIAALPAPVARAAGALLPGPATCLVPDPAGRYRAASGDQPGVVGLRAPVLPAAFAALDLPLIATSANHPGGTDPRRVAEVPADLRAGVAAAVDLGPLPGVASAVVDLRPLVADEPAVLVRPGPDPAATERALAAVGCTLRR